MANESLDFNFDSLVKFGEVEKEVEPIKGLIIVLRTLNEEEKTKAYSSVENFEEKANLLSRIESFKVPMLSYAIKSINGKPIADDEIRKQISNVLKKSQSYVVDAIYNEYDKLVNEQLELLKSGLKKNN